MRNLLVLAEALLPIAARAGEAVMRIYQGEFAVQRKSDDSPLTLADLESQRIILAGLAALTPELPVLSEESAQVPWAVRRPWRELWLVDPLDGTREFVKRNGEFTINIALVLNQQTVLGLIAAPARGVVYWGARGLGAHRLRLGEPSAAIRVSARQTPLRVVGSRSRTSAETDAYLAGLGPHVTTGLGSSLKFCLVAEGSADLYPRFGPTSEWDTAAGQALLEAAGGQVTCLDGPRLRYNCRESLVNGDFVAFNHPSAVAR